MIKAILEGSKQYKALYTTQTMACDCKLSKLK